MSVPPALNPAGNERNPRAYFGSHLSSTDQPLLSGPAPCAAGTFPHLEKLKLTLHKHIPHASKYVFEHGHVDYLFDTSRQSTASVPHPAFPAYIQAYSPYVKQL